MVSEMVGQVGLRIGAELRDMGALLTVEEGRRIARAAIEAMREPNEAMMSAVFDKSGNHGHDLGGGVFVRAWGFAIDAALEDAG